MLTLILLLFSLKAQGISTLDPSILKKAAFVDDRCHFFSASLQMIGKLGEPRFCKSNPSRDTLWVVHENSGLGKYQLKDGVLERQWFHNDPNIHHDMQVSKQGDVAFLSSQFQTLNERRLRHDAVWILDSQGKVLNQWDTRSLKSSQIQSPLPPIYKDSHGRDFFEITHLNAVEFVDGFQIAITFGRHGVFCLMNFKTTKSPPTPCITVPDAGFIHSTRKLGSSLILFVNYGNNTPKQSRLVRFDLQSGTFHNVVPSGALFHSESRGNISVVGPEVLVSHKDGSLQFFAKSDFALKSNTQLKYRDYGYSDQDFYQLFHLAR